MDSSFGLRLKIYTYGNHNATHSEQGPLTRTDAGEVTEMARLRRDGREPDDRFSCKVDRFANLGNELFVDGRIILARLNHFTHPHPPTTTPPARWPPRHNG